MPKRPKTGVRGRPWAAARRFHGWLAAWAQDRRRARQNIVPPPTPNAPNISNGDFEWDVSEFGFADVWINWAFVHGSSPVATLEVWVSVNAGVYSLHATVASTDGEYVYPLACNNETWFDFQVRYRNGATIGPFSNVYRVAVVV